MTPFALIQDHLARRWLKPLYAVLALAAGLLAVLLGPSAAFAQSGNTGFGFNAPNVAGGSGSVFLTGGGAFNLSTGFVHSAGGFTCTDTVSKGPLAGCLGGQGVRWDTASLLSSTGFTCAGETEPAALTDNNTVVLSADFYRAGDGNNESFTAKMIVSTDDFAPNDPGIQNVWVQGVGCETTAAHFSS
jgi:hypothetical protein